MAGGNRVIDRAPPPRATDGDGGRGGGGWAWLVTVRGIVEAELVRGLLENAGVVPVVLDATDPSPTSWMFLAGDVNALVKVYVPKASLDDARLTLLGSGLEADDRDGRSFEPKERRGSRVVWLVIALLIVAVFGWRLIHAACGSAAPC